ncbi:MAG: metal ABC transporter permease [Chloroflexi bacterium]|nr:metal ABC transporter permease [Chloroflexota bacterium]
MIDLIVEPMQYGFMQRALLVSALAATACGVVGTFVVLRGMAFMGDAIAHSALTGMAIAFLVGVNVTVGALVWAVPASLGISFVSRRTGIRLDAVIGVLFAGGFALGVILINVSPNYAGDLLGILFGNVLGASWLDVLSVGCLAGGGIIVVGLLFQEVVFMTYDASVAEASGIPVRFLEYLLPLLVALTTVASLQTVGNVMVMSLLVVPAVTGSMLARRLASMMLATVGVALTAIVIGLYLSFHANLPTGPAIVVVSVTQLLVVVVVSPRRWSLLARWRRRTGSSEPAAD